jgi:hypothetical protein
MILILGITGSRDDFAQKLFSHLFNLLPEFTGFTERGTIYKWWENCY